MEKRSTPVRPGDAMSGQKPRTLARDISESLGKLPPQALDLEEAVLGAVLLEKNAIIEVASMIHPDHFYSDQNKEIYLAIQELFADGSPIDMRTVVAQLRKNGKLEIAGGAYYIAELTSKVSSAANIEYHARLILEMSMKRSLINLASQIHHDAYEDTSDVFNLLANINVDLQKIHDNAIGNRAERSMKEIAFSVLNDVQSRQSGKHSGLDTGFEALDRMINGFQPKKLIIIAARPSMGKSAFAMQLAKQVSERGIPVGVFSLEMAGEEIAERFSCAESDIESDKVKKGQIENSYEWERFSNGVGKVADIPMWIDDDAMLNIVELRARALRMKTKYGIKLLVIDYLQLIKGLNDHRSNSNRDQEVGLITRTLKGISKELDLPVIALSQLSRAVEQRGGLKRPQLSDLRESGSIEQDADIVMFLYRPEYYKITETSDGIPTHGLCEVIIEKHRGGALGTVNMKFIGKFTKFTTWNMDYSAPTSTERQTFGKQHYKDPTQELPKDTDDSPF